MSPLSGKNSSCSRPRDADFEQILPVKDEATIISIAASIVLELHRALILRFGK
jgi:hypothetical protein